MHCLHTVGGEIKEGNGTVDKAVININPFTDMVSLGNYQ